MEGEQLICWESVFQASDCSMFSAQMMLILETVKGCDSLPLHFPLEA